MCFVVLIVSIILFQVEARLFVKMSMLWGGGAVLLWVLFSAYLGVQIIKYQQQSALHPQHIMMLQQQGRFHPLLLPMAIVRMLAGALLVVPGFFTDSLAIMMCVPPITFWVAGRFINQLNVQNINRWMPQNQQGEWSQQDHWHQNDDHDYEDESDYAREAEDVVIKVQGRVVPDDEETPS